MHREHPLPLCHTSAWAIDKIQSYLSSAVIPIRLACNDRDGFPLVCSLWYLYRDGYFWCAVHKNSKVCKLLSYNAKCAFEVASNEMPYKGVRGQGVVSLLHDEAGIVLPNLIDRYLAEKNQKLKNWLLSRVDQEFAIRIEPTWLTSWDFSARMSG